MEKTKADILERLQTERRRLVNNLDPFNQVTYDKYYECSLDEVMELVHSPHRKFSERVAGLSEEEMLQPGFFAWCKSSFYDWIGGYCAHDAWGKKQLRGWMKTQKLI
jgi:hypothetical protein